MQLLGAIYVKDGKVVSSYKGNIDQTTTYNETPLELAKRYKREGLTHVHFVDLNASQTNTLTNKQDLKDIIQLGLKVQYAGGVRSLGCIDELISMGVDQVVIGVSGADLISPAIKKHGKEKIVHGIKAKYDQLVTEKEGITNALDYVESLTNSELEYLLFKDVLSSGVMIHPNYDMAEKMAILSGKKVYTVGGISEIKHLKILKNSNNHAVIIGRAFYEKSLNIQEALEICS